MANTLHLLLLSFLLQQTSVIMALLSSPSWIIFRIFLTVVLPEAVFCLPAFTHGVQCTSSHDNINENGKQSNGLFKVGVVVHAVLCLHARFLNSVRHFVMLRYCGKGSLPTLGSSYSYFQIFFSLPLERMWLFFFLRAFIPHLPLTVLQACNAQ